MSDTLKSPMPYFGGKSKMAALCWERFGLVDNYVEPFFGSGAMLLGRPGEPSIETVNDADGLLSNFWRALASDPDAVAHHADWPVNECCPAGTMIATPGGQIPIEKIKAGMTVIGEKGGRPISTRVIAIKQSVASEFYQIGNLRLTENHPVWTPGGYVEVRALRSGDKVAMLNSEVDEIDLKMLYSSNETKLGNLLAVRPSNKKDSLCRGHVSRAGSISGTYEPGGDGWKNVSGLLDSFTNSFGASSDLLDLGNRNRRMAGAGAVLDFQIQKPVNEFDGRRRGESGLCSNARASGKMVKDASRSSLSAGAIQCHEGQASFPGRDQKNKGGQSWQKNAGLHARKDFSRTKRKTAFAKTPKKTIVGAQGQNTDDGTPAENFRQPVQAVYNFQTVTGNYFAENILVHNCDLHARHAWLVGQKDSLQARLEGDPEFYDCKIAGWWVWGMACWIGSGFCSGKGPWRVQEVDGVRQLVHVGNQGQGVNRQRIHVSNQGQGVNRQLVHVGNQGQGVNRKRAQLGGQWSDASGVCAIDDLQSYFRDLSARLRRVRVCCGDWSRVCGPSVTHKHGLTAVFLDPPYADTAKRSKDLYRKDCDQVAHAVREWAIVEGANPLIRIALCGYESEHQMPADWECVAWNAGEGFGGQKLDGKTGNGKKERIWFSPACLKPELGLF